MLKFLKFFKLFDSQHLYIGRAKPLPAWAGYLRRSRIDPGYAMLTV
jgi:hypothetical protein